MNLTPIPDPKPDDLVVRTSQHEIGILRVFRDNLNHSWTGTWTSLHDAVQHLNRCRKRSYVQIWYRPTPNVEWGLEEIVRFDPEDDILTVNREPWVEPKGEDDEFLLNNELKMFRKTMGLINKYVEEMENLKCSVKDCTNKAAYEVKDPENMELKGYACEPCRNNQLN